MAGINSDYSTMARIEPSAKFREKLVADLNIQGQVSFPDKLDLRAVIPVYKINPELTSKKFQDQIYHYDLAGVASHQRSIIVPFEQLEHTSGGAVGVSFRQDVRWIKTKLCHLFWEFNMDAAGRAAFAALAEGIRFRIYAQAWNDQTATNITVAVPIVNTVNFIIASAGNGFRWGQGSNHRAVEYWDSVARWDAAGRGNFVMSFPIEMNPCEGLVLSIESHYGNNFPANTTYDYFAWIEYVGMPMQCDQAELP